MTNIVSLNQSVKPDHDKLIEFFGRVLPPSGRRCLVSFPGPIHHFVGTNAEAATKALEIDAKPGTTGVFFALASQKPGDFKTRSSATAMAFKTFWLDIDCRRRAPNDEEIAFDQKERNVILEALYRMITELGLPQPDFVRSGGGTHVYFPLATPLLPDRWKAIALGLKARCAQFGIDADHAVTADVARFLRVPFTHNRKPGRGNAGVKWIPSPAAPMTVGKAREAFGELSVFKAVPVIRQVLDNIDKLRLIHALKAIPVSGIPKDQLALIPEGLRRNFDSPYPLWSNIGGAMRASYGDAAFAIFDAWSREDTRKDQYQGSEATYEKWQKLNYNELSVASVFALADALNPTVLLARLNLRKLALHKPAWLLAGEARI